jgi:hypothetical protein
MTFKTAAPLALFLLAACGGSPLGGSGTTPDPEPEPEPEPEIGIVIPEEILFSINSVAWTPGENTIAISIDGLDTTPLVATWTEDTSIVVPGYTAYSIQEDDLDRFYVALAAVSTDGAMRGVVAGDGGQFNTVFQGAYYERVGDYSAPDATQAGPANGQVSYAGKYAGLLNYGLPNPEPQQGTPPEVIPKEAFKITGDGFLNANFATNTVNGTIYNRIIVDSGISLGSLILIPNPGGITAQGTFSGDVENRAKDRLGQYAGAFGGIGATSAAGGIALSRVDDEFVERIEDAEEFGVFVMNQCGLPNSPSICDQVAVNPALP